MASKRKLRARARKAAKAEILPPEPMKISWAAMAEARMSGHAPVEIERIFARPDPMPGVIPAKTPSGTAMAMDGCLPAGLPQLGGIQSWAMASFFHEGMAFLGYPYLAELSQRGEYRRAAEIWAEHATRKDIKLSGPDAKVKALEAFTGAGDGGISLKAALREAIEHERLSGRCQVFTDFDDAEKPKEVATTLVIDKAKINRRRPLKRLKVVQSLWSYPGMYNSTNPLAPGFYKPDAWYVMGMTVSDSRMLTLVGSEVPDILKPAYAFGGMSLTQVMKPYVDNWLRTRQSVSDMVDSFSQMVLSTDLSSTLTGGNGQALYARVDMFNQTRSNRGTMVVDKDQEALTNVAVPISGLDKLQGQAFEQVAAAARIPLSIYLQITPSGLNASDDNEIRSFYADVKGYQEKVLRPLIHRILDIAQLSLFDQIDPEITFDFPDLWEMSAKELAEIRKTDADADQIYAQIGAVDNTEVRKRLNDDETSLYHGSVPGPAPEVEEPDETDTNDNDEQRKAA